MRTDDKKRNDNPKRLTMETAKKPIRHFRDLDVDQNALETALRVYELSKKFPNHERYALIDQIRRSSRSVCANIAEAWRKRRHEAAFISKYRMPKPKPPKPRCGSSLPSAAATWQPRVRERFTRHTTR